MTREPAQEQAKILLRSMRCEGKNHFWVQAKTSQGPRVICHLLFPKWNGVLADELDDKRMPALYRRLEAVTEATGTGFLHYDFSMPGQPRIYPKTSFMRSFEPWGWIAQPRGVIQTPGSQGLSP
jgi:methyl-accepting chemotaxis protein